MFFELWPFNMYSPFMLKSIYLLNNCLIREKKKPLTGATFIWICLSNFENKNLLSIFKFMIEQNNKSITFNIRWRNHLFVNRYWISEKLYTKEKFFLNSF